MAKKRKNSNYVGSKSYYAREVAKRNKMSAESRRKLTVIVSMVLILVFLVFIPVGAVDITKTARTARMGTGHADDALMDRSLTGRDIKYAEFTIQNYGKFVVLLDASAAPETVKNFVKLVNEGFYNGLTLHRANETIIQGGDPNGNGSGGSGTNIKGEFSKNGFANSISHKRGVISMARSSADTVDANGKTVKAYNSASSQFFICVNAYTGWDGQYAAFGYVVEGMSVVDEVNAYMVKWTNKDTQTIEKAKKQPVIKSIRILDDYTFTHEH